MARHDQLQKDANAGIDQLVAQYPILADKKIDREELTQADPDRLQRILLNDARDRKENIEQSITNITSEPEIIWQLPKIVDLTKISLQINNGAMDTYLKMYQAQKTVDQSKIDNSLMVLTLGLTILAVVPNPASPLAAYAGTALGGYMTVKEIQDFRVTSAAAGTAFDSAMALSSEDPSLYWLMFSVAMTVVDVSGSLKNLARVLSKAGKTLNTTQDLSAFKRELDLIKQNKALEQYHKILDKIEGNLLRAAQNEKDLQKSIGQLAEGIEAKNVLYFMPNDDPKIVEAIKKVAYYFAKQGIIKFDDFLLQLKKYRATKKLKGIDLDNPEVQKQLREIQEQGKTKFSDEELANKKDKSEIHATTTKSFLQGEGRVGTFGELDDLRVTGDNITPHHIPSDAYMKQHGISRDDGIAIMVEQPSPGKGGRHRRTKTYGGHMTEAERAAYYKLSPRKALEYDIEDLRRIYKEDGLYNSFIESQLQEVIKQNLKKFPNVFK